ncbi:MAG TPA: hypothetical protein VLQ45_28165 [Thermoanaerobaculia bacterium]|nr:hypothetical protein [Thermoanaerobaculia bacterium]
MRRKTGGTEEDRELMRGLFRLKEESSRAARLIEDLQSGARTRESLTAQEQEVMEGAPSIEFLILRSFSLRYSDPEGMLRCSMLAVRLADSLSPERYGLKLLADLKAKAWGYLANAYRITDQLGAAEEGFVKAIAYLQMGSGAPHIKTLIGEMFAALVRDQRRFSLAAELLEALLSYYRETGDEEAFTRTLLSRAIVAGQDNNPEDAIRWLAGVLRYLPHESDLKLSTIHELTINLIDAGYPAEAEAVLKKHVRLYRRSGKLNVLRRFWLQGRIAAALGNSRRAEGDLHVARLGFRKAGQHYDAALVSLDLALIYARAGQRTSTIRLVDEMVRTFRELGIAREAIASLLLLRKYCDRHWNPETICAQIETIALMVTELGRRQERRRSPSA